VLDAATSSILLPHLAHLEPAGHLDEAVGERRFAVVDMGDDGELRMWETGKSWCAAFISRG
jgi:hypothetical protein